MKVKNIRFGQTVVDKFGNEYVVEVVDNSLMLVYLRCTKIVKRVVDQQRGVMFECVDDCFWIYESKKDAKKDGIKNCITVESIKLKE